MLTSDIVDILVKIAEGINKRQSVDKILKKLSLNNKNKNLIAAIYSWIFEKLGRNIDGTIISGSGLRILSADELEQIGIENYNYILHLYNIGLLDSSDIEKIIDQSLGYPEGELDDEQLNLMVLSIFLETNAALPPGSRVLLYSSDTIN